MGKYALLTGASGGLGYQFAHLLAADGYDLLLVARNQGKLEKLKTEIERQYPIKAEIFVLDLNEEGASQKLFQMTSPYDFISCLINNAGFGYLSDFLDSDLSHQEELLAVNNKVLIELCYLYGQKMKERKEGYILNIASTAALSPGPHMATYFASKSFVLSFSEALHEEVKGQGIKVSCLCPGPTDTGFEKNAQMHNSAMFNSLPVSKPDKIAKKGYKRLKKGKAVTYAGPVTHWMAFFSRIFPRSWMRRIIGSVNNKTVDK